MKPLSSWSSLHKRFVHDNSIFLLLIWIGKTSCNRIVVPGGDSFSSTCRLHFFKFLFTFSIYVKVQVNSVYSNSSAQLMGREVLRNLKGANKEYLKNWLREEDWNGRFQPLPNIIPTIFHCRPPYITEWYSWYEDRPGIKTICIAKLFKRKTANVTTRAKKDFQRGGNQRFIVHS